MWHGDHWQNLLSSPMDARRYVMEDWSVSTTDNWNEQDGTAPAH
jgi:predicted alpha/beta hydrolase family esterase